MKSFRVLPCVEGDLITVRWVSAADPAQPDEVFHFSKRGETLDELLLCLPEHEAANMEGRETPAIVFTDVGHADNTLAWGPAI